MRDHAERVVEAELNSLAAYQRRPAPLKPIKPHPLTLTPPTNFTTSVPSVTVSLNVATDKG